MISFSSPLAQALHSSKCTLFAAMPLAVLLCLAGRCGALQNNAPVTRAAEAHAAMEKARHAMEARQLERAAEAYHGVLRIDPANVDARSNLGIVAMMRQDWAAAAEEFHKAIKIQPSLWKAQALLGLCESHMNHNAEAIQWLSVSLPHLEDKKLQAQAGLALAQIWYDQDELEKAAAVLDQLPRNDPTNADVLYSLYRVHTDLAYHALDTLALVAPDSGLLHYALAQHLVNDGKLDDAILEYRKALQRSPSLSNAHNELGQALLQQSHAEPSLAEAQREFEAALIANPVDGNSECMLGKIDLLRSDSASALAHYTAARKLRTDLPCANLGLAGLLIEAGKNDEALPYLEAAEHADPTNSTVRYRLASLYRKMGKEAEAEREMTAFQQIKKMQSRLEKTLRPDPSEE